MYRLLDHTADLAIEVSAADKPGLYAEAARAVVELACGRMPAATLRGEPAVLEITGQDEADLMINWLREILALINVEGKVPVKVTVEELSAIRLAAVLELVSLEQAGGLESEIKAVTYHQVLVEQAGENWRSQVVLDT